MGQPTGYPGGGIRLAKNMLILSGQGDPNLSSTPDVQRAPLNSAFLRADAPSPSAWFYQCSAAPVFDNGTLVTAAVWTAK